MTDQTKQPSPISLVPFSGSDHNSKHLTETNGQITLEAEEIHAKIGLILNWPEEAYVSVAIPGADHLTIECSVSADPDERTPTELYFNPLSSDHLELLLGLHTLSISIELFRTCYQFDVKVTGVVPFDNIHRSIVTSLPTAITTIRTRNLPRITLSKGAFDALPPITWIGENGENLKFSEISELGLNSIAGKLASSPKDNTGTLTLGELTVKGSFVRIKGTHFIFILIFDSSLDFGRYFEIYRKFAFPNIRPRHEQDPNSIFELYVKTKYLSQFTGDSELTRLKDDLQETWRSVSLVQHKYSADYITVDSNEQPCGASSIVHAFNEPSHSIWVFHQLCSVVTPNLLDCSAQLYTWRAEYLAASPSPLKVIGWFRSDSRWLERIYSKFVRITRGRSTLRPVCWIRGNVKLESGENIKSSEGGELEHFSFGNLKRTLISTTTSEIGGVGPEYLNVCASLNGILNITKDPEGIEAFNDLAQVLLQSQQQSSLSMHFTLAHGSAVPEGFEKHVSDRFFSIEKDDLGDFLSCVDHSIALTRRKFER